MRPQAKTILTRIVATAGAHPDARVIFFEDCYALRVDGLGAKN